MARTAAPRAQSWKSDFLISSSTGAAGGCRRARIVSSTVLLATSTSPTPSPASRTIAPDLRAAFTSGSAPVHDRSRLPRSFDHLHNGHEGSHHFLVHDFVTAVGTRSLPSVNAWVAARYTLPGIVAHESARQGGVRLEIPDFGGAPEV